MDELEAIQKTVPSHHQLTIDRQVSGFGCSVLSKLPLLLRF